jgi:two-component system KDP operon response regulator KdpE
MESKTTKILVVDDDPDLIRVMRKRLGRAGFDVVAAEDGVSCMSVARMEQPDLILLDLGLPAGDGFLSLRRLRQSTFASHTPIIVVTGETDAQARGLALDAGASDFITKVGTNWTELLDRIADQLDPFATVQ